MAELRAATPVVAGLSSAVKTCGVSFKGDASYMARCPSPWLSLTSSASPTAAQAELVFPRAYFAWCQRYLSKALQLRPAQTASAEFRVCWALDVWSHINYALFALNLPWADIYPVSANATAITELLPLGHPYFLATSGPSSIGWTQNEQSAFEDAKAHASATATTRLSQDQIDGAKLSPSPFSQLVTGWCAAYTPRDANFQKPNPVWMLLLKAVQPWSLSWGSNWLESKGGKDSGDFARADEVRKYFLLQWRMWSVQDFGYRGPDPARWPLSMGKANNCVTLDRYIVEAATEDTAPKIVFIANRAYPNLAFGLDAVSAMARGTVNRNFDKIVGEHLAWWFTRYAPQVAGDGTPVGRLPVTYSDMSNFIKGISQAATARAIEAGKNPSAACKPNDAACLKAATYAAQVQAAIKKSPLGGIWSALNSVRTAIMAKVGGAVGGGNSPFYVLRNPFARTLSTAGWGLVANGSTFDLGSRLVEAVANYTRVLPGLFVTVASAPLSTPTAACTMQWTRDAAGNDIPHCVPAGQQPGTAAGSGWGMAAVGEILQLYNAWAVQNPAQAKCVGDKGKRHYVEVVGRMSTGALSINEASAEWDRYVRENCTPKGFFAVVFDGFLRSSNPLG